MKYVPKTREKLKKLCDDLSVNLGDIDTSNITDMKDLFFRSNRTDFSGIETWNVSNVTDMAGMFACAESFNQPIGDWDVSNVTDMAGMFYSANSFNQPIGDWDVSNVTDMAGMFACAESFNQPIGDWDVSNVTNMHCMFYSTKSFNQPIGDWDVSHVMYMDYMFDCVKSFNQILPKDWAKKAGYKNPTHALNHSQSYNTEALFTSVIDLLDKSGVDRKDIQNAFDSVMSKQQAK